MFFRLNKRWSLALERRLGFFPIASIGGNFPITGDVADVGGGKKPFLAEYDGTYVGIDIDPDELANAPAVYTDTIVADITRDKLPSFDTVICRYTLEHVRDAEAALGTLVNMTRPGGYCYVTAPCRMAWFARLNRLLPEGFKKSVLSWIYPSKVGDGFPAHYDKASPAEYTAILEQAGAQVVALQKVYFSGYFTFLFPLHLLWRGVGLIQKWTNPNYCERFEMIFTVPQPSVD